MFRLFTLASLIALFIGITNNSFAQESKYDANKFYISLQLHTPDKLLPNGGWRTTWTAGTNILNHDKLLDPATHWIEESVVLKSYGEAVGRVFNNHKELFDYLRNLNATSKELTALAKITREFFGPYAVATFAQHNALSFRDILRNNDPWTKADLKKMGSVLISSQLEIAHEFDLMVCSQLLAGLKER